MKLEKAIEEGTQLAKVGLNRLTPEELKALRLLIEAGKRIQNARNSGYFAPTTLLPGETED